MSAKAPRIRIGVGGWVFEGWRKSFYPDDLPQSRELEHMSRAVTAIEINGTYYGSQKPESFRRWHAETPEDFVFAVKGPRFATNRRVLKDSAESVEKFLGSGVTELRDKLGPINWQFPPTKAFDAEDFAGFLALLPKERDGVALRHAVEVRHPSFADPDFVALVRAHDVAVIISGDSKFPLIPDVTASFVYLRMLGTSPDHVHGYSDADAMAWVDRMRVWAAGGAPDDLAPVSKPNPAHKVSRDVFAFVIDGTKEKNPFAAQDMIRMLAD